MNQQKEFTFILSEFSFPEKNIFRFKNYDEFNNKKFFFVFFSDEITSSFRRFGPLIVDWPHKAESKSYFPPKGYAFLLFQVRNQISNF